MKIRTFIAVDVPEKIKDEIFEIEKELMKSASEGVKWEEKEKFHITLKFLGDVNEEAIDSIYKILNEKLNGFGKFSIIYKGIGAFPDTKNPRVIWIGCEDPTGKLFELQKIVEEKMSELGFEKEDKEYHPHITLGRVKKPKNIHNLIKKIETINFEARTGEVAEVLIMKSDLKPSGSVYTVLKKIKL
ncbi:MAG: RNA 2',3'-cyclic phosphodiesterase [Candidatus Kryptonium sp.]|nr:RNA 2',3'-cyclic phosphodiesterase [Candidatus Kryptonium sp.]MCX7763092.1 RNA 2',3'-cyclic phosphodiesterase [Candidatus Kryptonium sp.]MDW8108433.1 RNA 2',3'-cyclic phosphodiesterase [Candidatus Kryptonium sp.]